VHSVREPVRCRRPFGDEAHCRTAEHPVRDLLHAAYCTSQVKPIITSPLSTTECTDGFVEPFVADGIQYPRGRGCDHKKPPSEAGARQYTVYSTKLSPRIPTFIFCKVSDCRKEATRPVVVNVRHACRHTAV
jgi:hypothetical protein